MKIKNYSDEADSGLVPAAQEGDMAAFEELVARHRNRIYARALSMVWDEEEAVDLSQAAWVKAWRRLSQFRGKSSFGTWITRIVMNLCLDHLRKQKRHPMESIDEMTEESGGVERHLPSASVNPAARLERAELRRRLDEALSQLSGEHRTVLVLREFEQMNYQEIAWSIGCSLGTVMSRLFYARRKMASLLAGWKEESDLQNLHFPWMGLEMVDLPN